MLGTPCNCASRRGWHNKRRVLSALPWASDRPGEWVRGEVGSVKPLGSFQKAGGIQGEHLTFRCLGSFGEGFLEEFPSKQRLGTNREFSDEVGERGGQKCGQKKRRGGREGGERERGGGGREEAGAPLYMYVSTSEDSCGAQRLGLFCLPQHFCTSFFELESLSEPTAHCFE